MKAVSRGNSVGLDVLIRKAQIKTTVRYHCIPIRVAKKFQQCQVWIKMWSNWNFQLRMQNGTAALKQSGSFLEL